MVVELMEPDEGIEKLGLRSGRASFRTIGRRNQLAISMLGNQEVSRLERSLSVWVSHTSSVILAMLEWLPPGNRRIIWIENLDFSYPSLLKATIREYVTNGLMKKKNVLSFDETAPYLADQLAVQPEHELETNELILSISACIIDRLDFKVLSFGKTDHLHFFEGNIAFVSADSIRISEAEELSRTFGLSESLV